jgi:formylglycine-generating enzyme required for sulfatase activity
MRRLHIVGLSLLLFLFLGAFWLNAQEGQRTTAPALLDCTGEEGRTAAEVKEAQEAWAKYLGRQVEEEDELAPGVKMKFVLVPPGTFLMGSLEGELGRSTSETQHEVTITRPFFLGKFEVTQAQYEALGKENKSRFKGADLPVENVSWVEVDAFARELSQKKAGAKLLYRLPTEAEWEYACRGGRSSSQPFGIGGGRSLSSREANFEGNFPYGEAAKGPFLEKTSEVGKYEANALGLHDMHGNVWEWCGDWFAGYPSGKFTDPQGPEREKGFPFRVYRGGSWADFAKRCRAAERSFLRPDLRDDILGFRLARVPSAK